MCFSVLQSWLLNSLKKMYSHTVKSENTVAKWPEDRQDTVHLTIYLLTHRYRHENMTASKRNVIRGESQQWWSFHQSPPPRKADRDRTAGNDVETEERKRVSTEQTAVLSTGNAAIQ